MNVSKFRLLQVMEECNEVSQRCSKAIRFGLSEVQSGQNLDNQERILYELNDLYATIELLFGCDVAGTVDREQIELKKEKIEKFLNLSIDLGQVTTDMETDILEGLEEWRVFSRTKDYYMWGRGGVEVYVDKETRKVTLLTFDEDTLCYSEMELKRIDSFEKLKTFVESMMLGEI